MPDQSYFHYRHAAIVSLCAQIRGESSARSAGSTEECLLRVVAILEVSVPVDRALCTTNCQQMRILLIATVRIRTSLGDEPRFVQCLHNFFWQRAFLQIFEVALKLLHAAHTNNDTIIAINNIKLRVVNDPSESCLEQSEVVLLHDGLDDCQRLESGVLEVALPVHAAAGAFLVAETAAFGHFGGLVLAAEEAAGDGVVDYDVQTVAAAGGDELGFDGAGDGVVL